MTLEEFCVKRNLQRTYSCADFAMPDWHFVALQEHKNRDDERRSFTAIEQWLAQHGLTYIDNYRVTKQAPLTTVTAVRTTEPVDFGDAYTIWLFRDEKMAVYFKLRWS